MDAIAIVLMFCWAGIVFLLAFLFEKQHRRLRDKLEELRGLETTKYRRKCFSMEWDESQSRRRIIVARSIYALIPMSVAGVIVLSLLSIFSSVGYAIFVPLLGCPLLLDNAIDMYRYSRAVQKVPLQILQDIDQDYMEEATEVLTTRPKLYFIVGLLFSVAAPFTPQLFNLLPFIMSAYARPAFFLVEKLGILLGIHVMLILFLALPTALLIKYKSVIRQMKRLTEWMRSKRWRK